MTNSINGYVGPALATHIESAQQTRLTELLDRLAHLFRGGREAVGRIFSKIFELAQDVSNSAKGQLLSLFERLRDLAKPGQEDKFHLEVGQDGQGYDFYVDGLNIVSGSIEHQDVLDAFQSVASKWEIENTQVLNGGEPVRRDDVAELATLHQAPANRIQAARQEMATYFKAVAQEDALIMWSFSDVLDSKFKDIPQGDSFWRDENPDNRRSHYDFRLKTAIFPGEGKESVFRYLEGEKSYSAEQQSKLIDLCLAEDKVHVHLDLANLFLTSKGLSPDAVDFAQNHFYIKGKDKTFIPDDGNCFFHCLDYLMRQQASPNAGTGLQGPVIDSLA